MSKYRKIVITSVPKPEGTVYIQCQVCHETTTSEDIVMINGNLKACIDCAALAWIAAAVKRG